MREVQVSSRSLHVFESLVGRSRVAALEERSQRLRSRLDTRTIWNINSTASGGGVAEMLHSLLRYTHALARPVRWLVLDATPGFFGVTKRIHNALHGSRGDGSALDRNARALFDTCSDANVAALQPIIRPGDIVICHDPQTAGLIPELTRRGAHVVWRCHIGHEQHDSLEVDRGWSFLRPYLEPSSLFVFSRSVYAPAWVHRKRLVVIPPNIDPFSTKNQELAPAEIGAILRYTGLIAGGSSATPPSYAREDESIGLVEHKVEVLRAGDPPAADTRLVVQVSRWDAMKDPLGVLRGFCKLLEERSLERTELVFAGPALDGVADDPEGVRVFGELEHAFLELPEDQRRKVHLALLPMQDSDENAIIVNALQRHATVIVQKSLVEGFGLTVTEALWKRRPVIASAVGGILEQIRDGLDGLLVHDPTDLHEFSRLLAMVLDDPALSQRLGEAGYNRVRTQFLSVTALESWSALIEQVLAD
jgi:trehalose synthase